MHQAAGLRAGPLHGSASLVPVVSPVEPEQAYEALYWLACRIRDTGLAPVILDATAQENPKAPGAGLMQVLDAPETHAFRPMEPWPILPSAQGLKALQATARAGGARIAVSRLLAPFDHQTAALLYAPADELAGLLSGTSASVMVPVLQPEPGSIDVYCAVKLLHQADLVPVLAPLDTGANDGPGNAGLDQVVRSVADCARRHLGLEIAVWPDRQWGDLAREGALTRTLSYDDMDSGGEPGSIAHAEVRIYWS